METDNLKNELVAEIRKINGVEVRPAPVSGGSALFYDNVPFAHFHNDNELDLRLTKRNIKSLNLSHPTGSIYHPNRSPNSAWIEVRFQNRADIEKILELVSLAVTALGRPTVG